MFKLYTVFQDSYAEDGSLRKGFVIVMENMGRTLHSAHDSTEWTWNDGNAIYDMLKGSIMELLREHFPNMTDQLAVYKRELQDVEGKRAALIQIIEELEKEV